MEEMIRFLNLRAKGHTWSLWNLITTMSQVTNAEGTPATMKTDLKKPLVPRSTPRVRPELGLHNTGEQLGGRAGLGPARSQLPSPQEGGREGGQEGSLLLAVVLPQFRSQPLFPWVQSSPSNWHCALQINTKRVKITPQYQLWARAPQKVPLCGTLFPTGMAEFLKFLIFWAM